MKFVFGLSILLLAFVAFVACASAHAQSAAPREVDWAKRKWIEKAARALRNGHGLTPEEDIEALANLPRGEALDKLMADPRFGDTAFDFATYFLGFKMNDLHAGEDYTPLAFEYPNAIESARAVESNGDFFKLFDLTGSIFIAPLPSPKPNYPPEVIENSLRPEEIRARREQKLQQDLQVVIHTTTSTAFCERFGEHLKLAQRTITYLVLPKILMINGPTRAASWYPHIQQLCAQTPLPSLPELQTALQDISNRNEKYFSEIAKFEPSVYFPKTVSEFKSFDLAALGLTELPEFGAEEIQALSNSSTNLDRKRSAYVLNRYFCDDLNPVGVETPAAHAGHDRHVSEASCVACHYKLDPMAGFFRNYGLVFLNYRDKSQIQFDDMAKADLATYEKNWRASTESGHDWKIGYFRSATDPKQNSYGESLEDLSRILREAPETKRCVAKRMFEYFVGKDQLADAGYIEALATEFSKDSSSSQAFKAIVKRLLQSESFSHADADPNECYDFAAGEKPADAPPCRVAHVFEQNCRQCHKSTGTLGHLDLTRWITLDSGEKTFPHLDSRGKQVDAKQTLTEILARLSTADTEKRMPQKKMMTSQDRQTLYLWAEASLQKEAP